MAATAPKSRSGRFGFLDPDDPDAEAVMRRYAQRTGQDPDQVIGDELASRRKTRAGGGSLDDLSSTGGEDAGDTAPAPSKPSKAASSSSTKGPSLPSPSLSPPRSPGEAGGFVLGLFLYVLALAWVRHGMAGVTGWVSAKFLNRPTYFPPEK